jgi:hypothetical protein
MNTITNNTDHSDNPIVESTTGSSSSVVSMEEIVAPIGLHAHWDCFSGAAGDMMLAACVDAAGTASFDSNNNNDENQSKTSTASGEHLLKKVEDAIKFGLPDIANEFSIECQRVWRGSGSITAMHVTVNSIYQHQPAPVPLPSTMASTTSQHSTSTESPTLHHDHGHEHHHHHHHHHPHDHHNHDHHHPHDHDHHAREMNSSTHTHGSKLASSGRVRNLPEIRHMLMSASKIYIPKSVRDQAIAVFTELAQAESTVHGASSINDVHFHEVGAIDSIVDTVGTLLALHYLNVTSVSCSRLPLGEGMVSTAHGILPVPAPATINLMMGMPITSGPPGRTGELVTPTAAALLRVLVNRPHDGRAPNMTLCQVGIGAGTKDFVKHPNIIRLFIGHKVDGPK